MLLKFCFTNILQNKNESRENRTLNSKIQLTIHFYNYIIRKIVFGGKT